MLLKGDPGFGITIMRVCVGECVCESKCECVCVFFDIYDEIPDLQWFANFLLETSIKGVMYLFLLGWQRW